MGSSSTSASFWAVSKIALGVSAALTCGAGLLWYGKNYEQEAPGKYFDTKRDYAMLPFDMYDAQNVCQAKTKARYGETLVRSQIDQHSTRFEANSGLYKVFLSAHLGDHKIYDEAQVHCFVNPNEYLVEHYRVFKKDNKSLMDKAISFFNFSKQEG